MTIRESIKISRWAAICIICSCVTGCSANLSPKKGTAASASLADVRAAIADAEPGDTVIVPAGSATWASQLIITKGINLIGAGIGKTVITSGWETSGWTDGLIYYIPTHPELDEPFRLSGFEIDCGGTGKSQALRIRNQTLNQLTKVRIDHNKFYNCADPNMITIDGYIAGVGDNNIINDPAYDTPYFVQRMTHQGLWRISWESTTFQFGSANQFYWEDNFITATSFVTEGAHGCRYCFRYNTIYFVRNGNWAPLFDAHGTQYRPPAEPLYSTMGIEIYENTVTSAINNDGQFVDLRGGMGLVYNNTMTTSGAPFIQVREEFDDRDSPPAQSPDGEWQHPNRSYFWNNTKAGGIRINVAVTQTVDYGGAKGIVPRENIDFWQQVDSFDGTRGMGFGPISSRPASCSLEGVGYWATDEKKLYRWRHGAWELYYTPYTYPHPLRTAFAD